MARVINAEVVLAMIEQAQQAFANEALRNPPTGPFAANYHHGVFKGMEIVRINILTR
jgi:hypothetical protein